MAMLLFVLALVCALLIGLLLLRFEHLHRHLSADSNLSGPQKFHSRPVPRIGGVPIFIGWTAAIGLAQWQGLITIGGLLLAASAPVFISGLTEDLTKKVGPLARLLAAFASAAVGIWLLGAQLGRLDIPLLDPLLVAFPLLAWAITIVAVGGVCHSINIIDGYNGLAGMVSALICGAMAYIAYSANDIELMLVCLSLVGAILGFLFWNYPNGLIFAGDGGAYLVGFLIAELAVLLVARNPEVSAWSLLLLVIYPVYETIFSIYRRKFLQGRPVGYPDALHLHSMIYRRLVRWAVNSKDHRLKLRRNSLTSLYLWALSLLSVVPAMLFWDNTPMLLLCIVGFILLYTSLYRRIVRFCAPRALILRRPALQDH